MAKRSRVATLKETMKQRLKGKAQVDYAQGCNFTSDPVLQADGGAWIAAPWKNADTLMAEAISVAKKADVIVCAMGEESEMSGESHCRASLEMFDAQQHLIEQLLKLGKPIVLLNFAGRPTVMTWEQSHIPAIMNVWFPGSEASDAICDVLFGEAVPSGKLTVSMPQATGQEPLYYNQLPTGRPMGENAQRFRLYKSNYLDVRNDPLYPFGYGLSYTTYEYSNLKVDRQQFTADDVLTVSVDVKNTGNRAGKEPVLLYSSDLVASIVPDNKRLRDFTKIELQPGQTKTVTFQLPAKSLAFVGADGRWILEEGEFDLKIGRLSQRVECTKTKVWEEANI
jgi:beta-glucosidase